MTSGETTSATGLARVVVMTMLEVADELQHDEFANIGCDS